MAASRPEPDPFAGPAPALVQALRRMLRPLVRLLVDQRVTFPFLANLLKEVYVEVADREYALEGKTQTTTRVSLLTGIHRKDVRRLREQGPDHEEAPRSVSLGAQLVARWTGDPTYLDESGQPRPLPRQRSAGPSFDGLVESVSKDIRPRAVLDEWLRLGVARLDADDQVTLHVSAFVPGKGFDEKAFFFGRNLGDHIDAGAHNLRGGEPSMPDRSVYYDGLTPEAVAELQDLAERGGMEAIQAVNRRAMALQRDLERDPRADRRINFGIYFLRGSDDSEGGEDA